MIKAKEEKKNVQREYCIYSKYILLHVLVPGLLGAWLK